MPKKIAIAARGISQGFSGPNEFIRGLARGFLEHAPSFNLHMYYDSADALGLFPGAVERVLPIQNRILWDQFALPQALKKDKIDLAIFPKGPMPLYVPCRAVSIMHDLGYFYPELNAYKTLDTLYMRLALPMAAKRASAVFAVSEYTRQDVIRRLHGDPHKVITIYEAPNELYQPIQDAQRLEQVRKKHALCEPFIFYPTSISPRKNINRVLDAYERVMGKLPHHLYMTGSLKWKTGDILERLSGPLKDRVHLLGAVPSEDMPAIYSLAEFSIYPSLFEGFGLPVIEAFLCGSPLLTSNLTSLPEVAGDAALIVDGYSVESIAEGILRMAEDPSLRASLRQKGFEQARKFSWKSTMAIITDWLEAN